MPMLLWGRCPKSRTSGGDPEGKDNSLGLVTLSQSKHKFQNRPSCICHGDFLLPGGAIRLLRIAAWQGPLGGTEGWKLKGLGAPVPEDFMVPVRRLRPTAAGGQNWAFASLSSSSCGSHQNTPSASLVTTIHSFIQQMFTEYLLRTRCQTEL